MSRRAWILTVVVVCCAVGAAAYVWLAVRDRALPPSEPLPALADAPIPPGPLVVFARQTGLRDGRDGSIGVAPLTDPAAARFEESVQCDRIHMNGGRGFCLARRGRFAISFFASILDAAFQPVAELELAGMPSRAQVSPSGRYAASTVFVVGHAYDDTGFSTLTSIADLAAQQWIVPDMEALTVRRNGQVFRAVDFNFWGVTFAQDDRTYFATLGTGGRTYLVSGTIGGDTLDVVADDVECPSLSPDNRRLAFKHRTSTRSDSATWRIQVLDRSTGHRHDLAETRNVDDQVQWLDDAWILYGLASDDPDRIDTWMVPADGAGSPQLFIRAARSAFVLDRTGPQALPLSTTTAPHDE